MKRVLFLVNRDFVLYNFRIELVSKLLADGYEVFICLPDGPKVLDISLNPRGDYRMPSDIERDW